MREGIKENGEEDSDKVVQAVLAERQARELRDLDKHHAAEKKVMVGDALLKLNEKYDKLRDELQNRHDDELARLKVLRVAHIRLERILVQNVKNLIKYF